MLIIINIFFISIKSNVRSRQNLLRQRSCRPNRESSVFKVFGSIQNLEDVEQESGSRIIRETFSKET